MPEVGDLVEFWRRDKGGPSQRITAEVLEIIGENWCVIRRDDTREERTIDPKRLRVIKLAPVREVEETSADGQGSDPRG